MTDSQKWTLTILAGALVWLLYLLAPVLTPFMVSALLSYLSDPVATVTVVVLRHSQARYLQSSLYTS